MNDEIVQLGDPEGNDGLYTIKIQFIYVELFEKLISSQKSPPKDLQWMIEFEACGTLFEFKFCLEGDDVKRTYLSHTATIRMWANEEKFNSLRETEWKINVKLGKEEEFVGTGRIPLKLYTAKDDREIGGSIQIESNQGKLFSQESAPTLNIIVEVQRSHIIILENLDQVDGAEKETISRLSDQLIEAKEKLEGAMEEIRSLKEDLNEKNSLIAKMEEALKQKEAFSQEISLHLEDPDKPVAPASTRKMVLSRNPVRKDSIKAPLPPPPSADTRRFQWENNDEMGYIQLGKPDANDNLYIVDITLTCVRHLEKLLTQKSPPKDLQFMLEFEAYGMPIDFDPFCLQGDDEKKSTYMGDKSTARIRANEEDFTRYLSETELEIKVKLILGEKKEVIGTGRIALEPLTVEDSYEIRGAVEIVSQQGKLLSRDSRPSLAYAIDLQRSPGFFAKNYISLEQIGSGQNLQRSRENLSSFEKDIDKLPIQKESSEVSKDEEALLMSLREEVKNLNRTQKELSKQADSRILDVEKRITLLENSVEIFQHSKTEMEKFSSKLNNLEAQNQRLRTDLTTEIGNARAELDLKARGCVSLSQEQEQLRNKIQQLSDKIQEIVRDKKTPGVQSQLSIQLDENDSTNASTHKTTIAAGTKRNSATLPETKATKMTRRVPFRPYSQSHKPSRPVDKEDDFGLETSTESSFSSDSYSPPSPEAIKPLFDLLPASLFSDGSLFSLEDQPIGTNQNKAKSEVHKPLAYVPPARRFGLQTYSKKAK